MGILSYIVLHYVYAAFVVAAIDIYMRAKVCGAKAFTPRVLYSYALTLVFWPELVRCWTAILINELRKYIKEGGDLF